MLFSTLAAAASLASVAFASKDRMDTIVKRQSGPTDVQILNYALTLEYLERDFYALGLATFSKKDFARAGYGDTVYDRFVQIAAEEKSHAAFLAGALGSAGVGECQYNFGLTSPKVFVAISAILEQVGTSAYLGAAPDITNKAYLAAAGSILTIEARHSAYLNELSGSSGFPVPYEQGLNYAQVYSLAAPFIIPGTCGTSGSLPSSIQAFPGLKVLTNHVRAGHDMVTFFGSQPNTQYYGVFLNGGTTTFVPVSMTNPGAIRVPKALAGAGATYLIISTNDTVLTNANTVAGPAFLSNL